MMPVRRLLDLLVAEQVPRSPLNWRYCLTEPGGTESSWLRSQHELPALSVLRWIDLKHNSVLPAGSSTYWLRSRSPGTPLNCSNCLTEPGGTGSSLATEPLQIALDGSVPTSIVSAQVRAHAGALIA